MHLRGAASQSARHRLLHSCARGASTCRVLATRGRRIQDPKVFPVSPSRENPVLVSEQGGFHDGANVAARLLHSGFQLSAELVPVSFFEEPWQCRQLEATEGVGVVGALGVVTAGAAHVKRRREPAHRVSSSSDKLRGCIGRGCSREGRVGASNLCALMSASIRCTTLRRPDSWSELPFGDAGGPSCR